MKLILLEDDPLISTCMEEALAEAGFQVLPAFCGREALDLLAQTPGVAGIVVDVGLNEAPDGWEVARRARQSHPHVAIVYSTTAGTADFSANAVAESILLEKPFTLDHAVTTMRAAVSRIA